MKKLKHLFAVWILLLSLLFQSNVAFAANVQDLKNTAPVANFTVEKSRQVKLLVLTDYTGEDNANLKSAITSMKSELANYAKINVEYANTTDTTIGYQQGIVKMQDWAKNAHATYRWTGYDTVVSSTGKETRVSANNKLQTDTFTYSTYVTLPEGDTPSVQYGVPTSYSKSNVTTLFNPYGFTSYITYSFINNNGLCAGQYQINVSYSYSYPNGVYQAGEKSFNTLPVFTYDDFWSVQNTYDQSISNTVTGWDLSKLNYEVKDNTDTYVVFALKNDDTNYYKTHTSNNYRLGQLRNDSNLGKYIKDSEARVYSICSDNLENINLSTNPQYPITLSSPKQNISLKELVNSSFDGRSIGDKNISGLVTKIKENVKRPSGEIDMVVATDNDIAATNSFINGIKDNISSDVVLKANIVDMDSLDDIGDWNKYTVKSDYRTINTLRADVNLVIDSSGDLWACGTNAIMEQNGMANYGLFGQSTTISYYNKFIKIASNVKDAIYVVNNNPYSSILILKNDGTIWMCGNRGTTWDKNGNPVPINVPYFTQLPGFSNIKSFQLQKNYKYCETLIAISNSGALFSANLAYGLTGGQIGAPANTEFYFYTDRTNTEMYYVTTNGTIYCTGLRSDNTWSPLYIKIQLPTSIIYLDRTTGLMLGEDNKIYSFSRGLLTPNPVKQVISNNNITYPLTYYIDEVNDNLYFFNGNQVSSYGNGSASKLDKIFTAQGYHSDSGALIGRDLNGKIGYWGGARFSPFDASYGDLAADYLAVGSNFAYITKNGDICSGAANYGKIDGIIDSSPFTTKAFSKSKILNTDLREGSERYFVYVSDNIEKDTYFKNPSDYFLFGNLDSEILNYLKENNFNIYVVSPEEAKNLKLQFPYVPTNKQQNTLKDLVDSSNMDSAFCIDTDTVQKLIIKKYDTYTKQGTKTLTVLVNEESVRYNVAYNDFENDPRYSEKWQYTHDPDYFDNSNGIASFSGQWLTEPIYIFDKVGKYTVVGQFRDNPKDNTKFDNYRLWSNISTPATIIVHRRPIALFNTLIANKAGSEVNLTYLDKSYDLDHNISRSDKGIAARVWMHKKSTSDTWIDGKPSSLTYNTGIYQIQLLVKDIEGVWSKPYIDTIDTANIPPSISATPDTYDGPGSVDITITASDNGENDFAYMRYAVTNSTDLPTAAQWVKVADGTKVKSLTIDTDGTYYLHMEANDTVGQIGKNMAGPYIINNVKAGHFYVTMMLDPGWRSYYFETDNGIDSDNDGVIDQYPKKSNTDIGTPKMPINYYSLVGHPRTYIKAGYKVKGKIDIQGDPDSAEFYINYLINNITCTDTVALTKGSGITYYFEWTIPLETDNKSFVSFDLELKKGSFTYGNEKWDDTWDPQNTSRLVFYVKGKATDDLIYVQSQ